MSIYMSAGEARLILESLSSMREKFTGGYPRDDPREGNRKERLTEINRVMDIMRVIRDEAKLAERSALKAQFAKERARKLAEAARAQGEEVMRPTKTGWCARCKGKGEHDAGGTLLAGSRRLRGVPWNWVCRVHPVRWQGGGAAARSASSSSGSLPRRSADTGSGCWSTASGRSLPRPSTSAYGGRLRNRSSTDETGPPAYPALTRRWAFRVSY